MSMNAKKRLSINTLFNAISQFWMMGISIFLTPFIIHDLGNELFGYWVLFAVISGYCTLIDMGIGVSLVRFFSEYNTKKDIEGFNKILNTGFTFNLIVSLAFFVLIILSPQIMSIVNVSENFYKEVIIAFCLNLVAGIVANQFGAFQAIIAGLQRYDITNKIQLISSVPYIFGTVLVLYLNLGIIWLAVVNGICIIFQVVLYMKYAYKLKSGLTFRPLQFHMPTFRLLFGYGIKVKVSNLSDVFNFQLDNLLLGMMVGPLKVTTYEVGAKITRFVRSLSLWLLPAVVPASAELAAAKDYYRIQILYEKGSRYLFAMVIPTVTFTLLTSGLLIYTWLGPGYRESASLVIVLLLGYTANIMTGIGSMILRGIGKPQYEMRSKVITIVLNLSLSILLILKYGIWGAVIGTTLAMVIGSSYFFYLYHLHMAVPFLDLFKKGIYKPLLASLISGFAVFTLNRFLHYDSRIMAGIILFFDMFLFGGFYFIFLFILRFFDNEEKVFAKEFKRYLLNKTLPWLSS